jgi:hypothetical protein
MTDSRHWKDMAKIADAKAYMAKQACMEEKVFV